MRNECVAKGLARQPCGRLSGGRLAALLLSHRALQPCSFVAPCQTPAGKSRTHSSFINRLLGAESFRGWTSDFSTASDVIRRKATELDHRQSGGARPATGAPVCALADWSFPRLCTS